MTGWLGALLTIGGIVLFVVLMFLAAGVAGDVFRGGSSRRGRGPR